MSATPNVGESSIAISDGVEAGSSHITGNANPEKWTKTPRPRGRQPKDPHAVVMTFHCRDVEDIETNLRGYIQMPTAPAEHATIEFHFPVSAAFMVYTKDFKPSSTSRSGAMHLYDCLNKTAVSVIEVLQTTVDPKDQVRRQKAVAKACVEAIQKADGYRYSFHNNWLSREDEASRFSYFCNDSTLNKGRAANEGAGTVGKEKRKPVYDCQGLIAVKFSATKQNLEVHYRHIPLHKTYEERAPPPRKESRRRKLMEILNPGLVINEESTPEKKTKRPSGTSKDLLARKRHTKSSPAGMAIQSIEQAASGEGNLQHLIEFLGATEQVVDSINDLSTTDHASIEGLNDIAGPPLFPMEKLNEHQPMSRTSKAPSRVKKITIPPRMPGEMSGTIKSGTLSWSPKRKEIQMPVADHDQLTSSMGPLRGIAQAAVAPLSELEALKAKLIEAEEKIKRLESEKGQSPSSPGYGPYPYPPPPIGYSYPAPSSRPPYHYPMPPSPTYQHEYRPLQIPSNIAPRQFPNAQNQAGMNGVLASKPVTSVTKCNSRSFIAYSPKEKRSKENTHIQANQDVNTSVSSKIAVESNADISNSVSSTSPKS